MEELIKNPPDQHICQTSEVVVFGAGITGLAAGYFLKNKLQFELLEASDQVGGVIKTSQVNGFLLEHGPDCIVNPTPELLDFLEELGLTNQIVTSNSLNYRVFLLQAGELLATNYQDPKVTQFLGHRASTSSSNTSITFKSGMQALPLAIASHIQNHIRFNRPAHQVLPTSKPILSTLPVQQTLKLLDPGSRTGVTIGSTVKTTSLYLGYRKEDFPHSLDAFGVIVPPEENRSFSAITFTSSKFEGRCPSGCILLRIFTREDPARARADFEALFQLKASPVLAQEFCVEYANPQYPPDQSRRVDDFEASLPEKWFVAGSPYRGVSIENCILQAKQAANSLARSLEQ